jgi:hypothetical protein
VAALLILASQQAVAVDAAAGKRFQAATVDLPGTSPRPDHATTESTPVRLAYVPKPAPAETHPDWDAVRGGLILFGVGYGLALAAGVDKDFAGGAQWLSVPVAGPWATLAAGLDVNAWAIAADGVVQLLGGLITVGGFAYPKRTLRAAAARVDPDGGPSWTVPRPSFAIPNGCTRCDRFWALELRKDF